MRKGSSHIQFSCRIQESQQMEKEKKKKKNLGGRRIHQPDQNSNASNGVCGIHHLLTVPEPRPSSLDTLSLPARSGHDTTKQQPNPPTVRFRESFQRIKGGVRPPAPALLRGEKGRPREEGEPSYGGLQLALARSCALLPVTAWNPVLMLATEQREWHVSHCRKQRRVSFCRMVSGERQV